jgi:hypothetical protein
VHRRPRLRADRIIHRLRASPDIAIMCMAVGFRVRFDVDRDGPTRRAHLQMLRTVASLISLWRGTLAIFRLVGLSHTVCAPPSGEKTQPSRRRCCSGSRRFMPR